MTVEKHLILTGISNVSWKDAITKTIAEASKTIDYISEVKVLEQKAKIDGNKIIEYYSTIELTFSVDLNRE
ncbi:MAG: dodecin domain-containing protein [Clostridia bacterium]|nr:dodecin domain-containing protein [Clostridia bacterium]